MGRSASNAELADLPKPPTKKGGAKARTKAKGRAKAVDDKVELWHRAWFLKELGGMGEAAVGEAIGVSGPTARSYAAKWKELLAGSVDAAEERDRQLMVLGELEQRLVREGISGKKSWAELAGPLRGVLSDRRELCGLGGGKGKQVTVELGAAAGVEGGSGMPAALAHVVARVTVSDKEEDAA